MLVQSDRLHGLYLEVHAAERLAQPIAEEARKKDVAEVMAAIEKYGEQYRRHENLKAIKKDGTASVFANQ